MEKGAAWLESRAIRGLGKCVAGYSTKEVKTTYEIDEDGNRRVKSEVVTIGKVAPNFSAVLFALTNLDPSKWKAKLDSAFDPNDPDDPDGQIDTKALSEETLRELAGYKADK